MLFRQIRIRQIRLYFLFVFYSFCFVVRSCFSGEPKQNQEQELVDHKLVDVPTVILLLAVPRRLFCFGSLVILDVVIRYLSLFFLYINIEIGKNRC